MYNVQGDVIGIVDEDTGNVVATYAYDAWGRCTLIENAEGYTVGTDNPFRYRGITTTPRRDYIISILDTTVVRFNI